MKIEIPSSARTSGSAVIVVLALLFLMVVLININSLALHRFKRSLQSIEHRELKKYNAPVTPEHGAKRQI